MAVAIEAIIFLIVVSRFVKPFQSSSYFNKCQKTAAGLNDRLWPKAAVHFDDFHDISTTAFGKSGHLAWQVDFMPPPKAKAEDIEH